MKRIFIVLVTIMVFISSAQTQGYNIGVRSGLNYSTFSGTTEVNESYGYSGGFHFGISYQRNFHKQLGLRSEFLYIQNGGTKSYTGPSYFVIRTSDEVIFEKGDVDYFLNVSNAYLSFPVTLHFKPLDKWEFYAGAYVNISIGPNANGRLDFQSTEHELDVFFSQRLKYNYYSDEATEGSFSAGSTTIFVDDQGVVIPNLAGAYYQLQEKEENTYKTIDYGLIGGVSYYFNRGFYFSARVNYGLRDLTNTALDFSLTSFNEDKTHIKREDSDKHLGLEFSLGFKF